MKISVSAKGRRAVFAWLGIVLLAGLAGFATGRSTAPITEVGETRQLASEKLIALSNEARTTQPQVSLLLAVGARRLAKSLDSEAIVARQLILNSSLDRFVEIPGVEHGVTEFAPDGETMASLEDDGQRLIVWDRQSGRHLASLRANVGLFPIVQFSPDGTLLAAGGGNGVKVWDAMSYQMVGKRATGLCEKVYYNPCITDLAFATDGLTLHAGTFADRILTYKFLDRRFERVRTVKIDQSSESPCGGVEPACWSEVIALSPDQRVLAVGGAQLVYLFSLPQVRLIGTLRAKASHVESLSFAPSGVLAAGYWNGNVVLWNTSERSPIRTVKVSRDPVSALDYRADGQLLAAAAGELITVYELRGRKRWLDDSAYEVLVPMHSEWITDMSFAISSHGLVSSGDYGSGGILWDTARMGNGKPKAWATSYAFAPQGTYALAGDLNGATVLRAGVGGPIIGRSKQPGEVVEVGFDASGERLFAANESGIGSIFETSSMRRIGLFKRSGSDPSTYATDAAMSADATLFSIAYNDGSADLWDVTSHKLARTVTVAGDDVPVLAIDVSSDGEYLATVTTAEVLFWDVSSGTVVRRLRTPSPITYSLTSLGFSPDGAVLATGTQEGAVILWDVEKGSIRRIMHGHDEAVWSLAFSPNGRMIATGAQGGEIILWDPRAGVRLATFPTSGLAINDVAFTQTGSGLAYVGVGAGGMIDSDVSGGVDELCRMANRQLTEIEWQAFVPTAPYLEVCP